MKSAQPDQKAFVGIDFGTTKTMVANYDAAKQSAKPLILGRGKFEMPTSMYVTEADEILFGDDADDEGITDLPNHIRRFKMNLGKPGFAHVGRISATAQELTSDFLCNLRKLLEEQVLHTTVSRVVLTVPAMFGPAQRHDLTSAANKAGFTHVELLQEPVAAGIAYCDHQSDLSKELRFIVVDWGGGTFDVALLERSSSGEIKIHDEFVVGLDDIGGEIFDDELWSIASRSLDAAGHGKLTQQPRENWGRYRRDLSRAKERLSTQLSVSMTFTLANGTPAKITFERTDFNKLIDPMIQRAAQFVTDLIVKAHNAGLPPEFILLAGGTSRIPQIAAEFERITTIKCRQWSDGREAVALGAAIEARRLWVSAEQEVTRNGEEGFKLRNLEVYRRSLETANCEKKVSKESKDSLLKQRSKLWLTKDEANSLEVQILGRPLEKFCIDGDRLPGEPDPKPGTSSIPSTNATSGNINYKLILIAIGAFMIGSLMKHCRTEKAPPRDYIEELKYKYQYNQ